MVMVLCVGESGLIGRNFFGVGEDWKLQVGGVESPLIPPYTHTLKPLLLVGQSSDFQDIFHGVKDLLKSEKIQNQKKI